jgi:hypothetical protein
MFLKNNKKSLKTQQIKVENWKTLKLQKTWNPNKLKVEKWKSWKLPRKLNKKFQK